MRIISAVVLVLMIAGAFPGVSPGLAPQNGEKDTCDSFLKQEVPAFRIAKRYRTDLKLGIVLQISVAPSDIERDKLLALACKLGRKYGDKKSVYVWVCDSFQAAKRYNPQSEGNDSETMHSCRARYGLIVGTREESLDWRPDRNNPGRWIHIDLSRPSTLQDSH